MTRNKVYESITIICQVCDKPHKYTPAGPKKKKYCSTACKTKRNRALKSGRPTIIMKKHALRNIAGTPVTEAERERVLSRVLNPVSLPKRNNARDGWFFEPVVQNVGTGAYADIFTALRAARGADLTLYRVISGKEAGRYSATVSMRALESFGLWMVNQSVEHGSPRVGRASKVKLQGLVSHAMTLREGRTRTNLLSQARKVSKIRSGARLTLIDRRLHQVFSGRWRENPPLIVSLSECLAKAQAAQETTGKSVEEYTRVKRRIGQEHRMRLQQEVLRYQKLLQG